MCGICGIVHLDGEKVTEESVTEMMEAIRHRGPDDEGVYLDGQVGLGHVRLSILDLSQMGHQPMLSSDGNRLIVFNGEIYNYLELKHELSAHYQFKTKTDTEVILAAYDKWGEDCLDKFNGDWAFVIYDINQKEVFGARDRYGIKPFYYFLNDQSFVFASEIKALTKYSSGGVNHQLIYDMLIFNRTDHTDDTFFEGVHKIPKGSKFRVKNGQVNISQWYNLREKLNYNLDQGLSANSDRFGELFTDSIKLRMRSDVPVGICLSGGLDSSAITSSLVKNFGQSEINTFSAIYKGYKTADESEFIELYNDTLSNMHFTSPDADTFYSDLKDFIQSQSEPVANIGPYAQYTVMRLAKEHVKVTLDGQGADELLAGYHYFYGIYYKELTKAFKLGRLSKELFSYLSSQRSTTALKYWLFYMLPIGMKDRIGAKLNSSIEKGFFEKYRGTTTLHNDLYSPGDLRESLLSHFLYKLEHLLKWEDHNAMNFSIESRVPFLDHRLVEFVLSLGPENAIHNGQTKFLLRNNMKGILPEPIRLRRDKKGFSTPSDSWFKSPKFKTLIKDIINSKSFKERGIFDPDICEKSFNQHLSGQANNTKEIWKWINTELWFKQFVDN